jgi:hypothetical protein
MEFFPAVEWQVLWTISVKQKPATCYMSVTNHMSVYHVDSNKVKAESIEYP